MNVTRYDEEAIFYVACSIAPGEARDAYLTQVCGGDSALRRRVLALLCVCEQETSFLEAPPFDDAAHVPGPIEQPGTSIGPYSLLEVIGEGGMGVVYLAEQSTPVRRKVALKVIKPGMDTKQVVARFEAERQALAMMDHPNIARVFDGGTTDSGRPYFVMEAVRGLPITEYCDREQLSVDDRLDLFVLVCRAVQHAHQKGVIHRDLKPSNVLVTVIDGVGVPKVIDFGIAKATGQSLTGKTVFTGFHQFVGTPLYVSPEQAELSGVDVDTRSDIYSLGVLLYELLTGTTPFDSETLKKAAFDEMRRIIREEEPPRPSTRLSSLGETLSTVSAKRKADPRRLGASMKGELDWVVMKALEKDRSRRYETANDFAADVMRYLTDRPVEACPPSAWYRLTKFTRRNRASLTTAGLLMLALVGGTGVSIWQAIRATNAGALAAKREVEARDAAAESKAVLQFLIQDLLGESEPEMPLDLDVKVADVLANAEKKVDTAFQDRPLVEAGVRHALGSAYHALSRYDVALRHHSRALTLRRDHLSPEHPATLQSYDDVADLYIHLGRLKEARKNVESLIESRRRVLGTEHRDTLNSMHRLASALRKLGQTEESRKLYEQTLEIQRRVLGPEDRDTLDSLNSLAILLAERRKFDEARQLMEQTLEAQRRVLGPEHPYTLNSMQNLAGVLRELGRLEEARQLVERVLEARLRLLGPDHGMTLNSQKGLAVVLMQLGRIAEGRKHLDQALAARDRLYGPKSEGAMDCAYSGLEILANARDVSDEDLARAVELGRRLVRDAPKHALSWKWLGLAEYRTGNWDAAIEAERKCIELRGDGGWAFMWLILALAHERQGDREKSREWFEKTHRAFENDDWGDTPRWLVDEATAQFGAFHSQIQPTKGPRPEGSPPLD